MASPTHFTDEAIENHARLNNLLNWLMHWVNGKQDAKQLVSFPCEWTHPLSCPCHKYGCIPWLTTNWSPCLVDFDPLIALSTIYVFPVFASILGQFFSGILQQLHSWVPCLKLIHSTHGSNQACHQFLEIKFFWNRAMPIDLHIVFDCFHATEAELSSWDRDRVAHSVENIYSLTSVAIFSK